MDRLICSPEMRLGRHSVHEIMSHPFFHGVDWANIRRMESPFVPVLNSITDTSYFPTEDLDRVPDYPEQHGTSLWVIRFCSCFALRAESVELDEWGCFMCWTWLHNYPQRVSGCTECDNLYKVEPIHKKGQQTGAMSSSLHKIYVFFKP